MPTQETVTIKEATRIAIVVPLYMRKLVRDGKIKGHKDQDGRWRVDKASVIAYAEDRKQREEERIRKIRMGIDTQPTRPTVATCARMRKMIDKDTVLSKAHKDVFLTAIDRYEKAWDAAYKKRGNSKS